MVMSQGEIVEIADSDEIYRHLRERTRRSSSPRFRGPGTTNHKPAFGFIRWLPISATVRAPRDTTLGDCGSGRPCAADGPTPLAQDAQETNE